MKGTQMTTELLVDRPAFTVRRAFVSSMNNAVYLVTARRSGEQVLIDAADDAEAISDLVEEGAQDAADGARLAYVVTTHAHWDHTRATAEIAAQTGAHVAIGREDAAQLKAERGIEADMLLDDGDLVHVDGVTLDVIGLRGHTAGSVALALDAEEPALLFTGDSLFPGGVGNTGDDPERFAQLFGDVTTRLFDRFADDTIVFPGHGEPTTLGAERPALPEWRARGW
ncbi:glyoxylase-like metal-dependent hydrolase (beta-lactamase superfamily II) [Paramicrobacterium agarici]|uniref:Glyoxylase-like metal-dependent hydrolase (Beta-lactamase superfamily II) n=2 Tax=Paramicrobacterium agarici TaxID=630514 RepID=A0A2A9DS72_9MICO|nr:glyoxylase-like metal-dependent hydrolase (beta-lactamase superfamily II) [Microbacterium agarici]TQO22659.1 glyoxylase-like metal-dependent hydrolase (beta-lactamase superfamily II) [Microbacterium agarici]